MVSMPRSGRIALLVGVLVALGAVLAVGLVNRPTANSALPPVTRGTPNQPIAGFKPYAAPPLNGKTLEGKPFSLAAYRGRPVVINFWQSYCEPCREEAPAIAAASTALAGQASFVGVDVNDTRSKALHFADQHGWRYPLFPDPNYSIGIRYGVVGLPTTFFVDARGRVVDKIVGVASVKAIRDRISAIARA
jgi:cytochrome c biogenesis protein CcmG/thiol:disulfide interchange protein DsbE